MLITLTGMSMPIFWMGLLLINFFAVTHGILPVAGWGTWRQAIMPVMALALGSSAVVARMTRASLIEVLDQDYIRTAYAKGLAETKVLYKHALRNALIPVITLVGLQFGGLLTGAIITESIFAINGMGRLVIDSIRNQDFPVAQGGILIFSIAFMVVNLIVDVLYRFVNKRIDLS
jgi:peptide/nickel transport system permease protein